MTEQAPIAVDTATVRAFTKRLHDGAAAALAGASQPGSLQLDCIHPDFPGTHSFAFTIGQHEAMAEEAIRQADNGFNVYAEARTVTVAGRGRGRTSATRGVFAFVIDADADKGRGSRDRVEPSLIVETSPGNMHRWLFLARALPPDDAKPIGAAIRASTGADTATGVLTQPYRVAGTPNFPGRNKRARGRVATITRILATGRTYTADELRTLFPEQPKAERAHTGPRAEGLSGKASERAEEILRQTHANGRAAVFHGAAIAAFRDGLTIDDFEALCRSHLEGPAGKFLEDYDRLRTEIERSWSKIEEHAARVRQGPERPTYEDASASIHEARDALASAILRFIETATAYRLAGDDEAEPPVHGLATSTGTGKSSATAKAIAEHILSRRGTVQATKPILYAVPTIRLGTEIEAQFAEHGVVARVFRGRQQPDPYNPDRPMCDDLETVEIALSIGAPVSTSCCKGKRPDGTEALCSFFHSCAYQRQRVDQPDVWLAAHQMLFHEQKAIGDVEMVIVDEGFWQAGTVIPKRGLTLDQVGAAVEFGKSKDDARNNDIEVYRAKLARALRRQEAAGIGGVAREHLVAEGITTDLCTDASRAEWSLKGKAPLWPGMPKAERRLAARVAEQAKHARGYIALWHAAKELLYADEGTVSGRLYLDAREDEDGKVIVAKARGVRAIVKSWQKPTLLLDATLPSLDILRAFYPQAEAAPPIEAAMPHVRVHQVRDAPVAARKLKTDEGGKANRNLRAIRRHVLRRYIELRRAPVLVIAQKAVAEWLRGSGLPAGIAVEWFNNVAGLDRYKDVRGLITIGRTQPPPTAAEALAGALTGLEPARLEGWYEKAVRGVRTRDGSRIGMECDAHPDPVAEAVRWQVCDGELMQAIGRARGVNRTACTPLDIDIMANVVLPVTVDAVTDWEAPDEGVEMVSDGVILTAGTDMAAAWPEVWASPGSARNWILRQGDGAGNSVTDAYIDSIFIGVCDAVRRFRYQRAGAKQKWRTGAYDPAVVPDIRAWLEARLGELAGFDLPGTAAPSAAEPQPARAPFPRAADIAPGLAAAYRCVVDRPADPTRPAPVRAEIVRFDPSADIVFPTALAARLERIRAVEDAWNEAAAARAASQRRTTGTRPSRRRRTPELAETHA